MLTYLVALFVICTVPVLKVFGEPVVTINKADIEAVDKEFITMSVKIRPEGGKSVVDVESDLLQDINDDVFMQVQIDKKVDGSYVSLYKSDIINRCHFAENRDKYPVEKALTDDFNKYGNLLQNCPMKKGHYFLKGYQLAASGVLAEHMTAGDFSVHFILMREVATQMKTLVSMRWYTTIQ